MRVRTLFLDLGSHTGSIACVDEAVQYLASIDHRIDDAELITRVENALSTAGWKYTDLDSIACVIGPGGFTSLRVAVGLANALSDQLEIPAAGIHLSDLYQLRVTGQALRDPETRNTKLENFLWLHSTKKSEVFARGFGSLASKIPEATHFTLLDLQKFLEPGLLWTGELIPEHEKIVNDAKLLPLQLESLESILPSFVAKSSYSKETLLPWYGRGW